ncbi:hypothetical protein GQ457_08G025620 [Hibiscus cannabinus]
MLHGFYPIACRQSSESAHVRVASISDMHHIIEEPYRLHSMLSTPRANRDVSASVVWAILPKARRLRIKSVL